MTKLGLQTASPRTTWRTRLVPVLGLLLAATLTACGSDGGGDDNSAASGEDNSEASEDDSNLDFYQCLRDGGLDVEDPANPNAMVLPDSIDRSDPDQMAVVEDCAEQHGMGGGSGGAVTNEGEGEVDPEAMIEFAECMRENGVDDFPDPGPEGGLNMAELDPDTPEFQAAMEECGELLGGSGPVVR